MPVAAADEVLELANGFLEAHRHDWRRRRCSPGMRGALGARHALRALDAIHVATALALAEAGPVVVSWDRRLRRAAVAEGLAVYPETTTAALR